MKQTISRIHEGFTDSPLRAPYAYAVLSCGHAADAPLVAERLLCRCGHEGRDWNTIDGCPKCGRHSATVTASPDPHNAADRLVAIGDEVECERCDRLVKDLEAIRNLKRGEMQHARYREWCGRGIFYIYQRSPESPTGVELAMSVEATKEAEDLLREKGLSPLSPTEGLAGR